MFLRGLAVGETIISILHAKNPLQTQKLELLFGNIFFLKQQMVLIKVKSKAPAYTYIVDFILSG